MAIIQAFARVYRASDDVLIARGNCAIHLADVDVGASSPLLGTLLVERTGDEQPDFADELGHRVELEDGRWIHVVLTKRSRGQGGPEVLKFRGAGPLHPPRAMPSAS